LPWKARLVLKANLDHYLALYFVLYQSRDGITNRVTVGWANGSIVNPTFPHESVGLRKDAAQPTPLLPIPAYIGCINISI